MVMHLSGDHKEELQNALNKAFPTKASLEHLLSLKLEKNLEEIAGGNDLTEVVFTLIKVAEAQGWIERLIYAARNRNPGNLLLKAIAEKLLEAEYFVFESKKFKERYTIDYQKEAIGKGRIAKIYKALDSYLDRHVAIKILERQDLKDIFLTSVRDAVKISDEPNFISIYDYQYDERIGYCYYVMKLLQGDSLRQKIATRTGEITFNSIHETQKFLYKIGNVFLKLNTKIEAEGLKFDYDNIKPSNIIVNNKEPYISSFNLYKDYSSEKMLQELDNMSANLETEKFLEELAYLLPESFAYNKLLSFDKSAQYILGLLAYEILTGEIPHTLESFENLKKNYHKAFQPLTSITKKCPECPDILEKVIIKMTDPEPKKRYSSLEEAVKIIGSINVSLDLVKESYERCIAVPDDGFFRVFYKTLMETIGSSSFQRTSTTEGRWYHQYQQLKDAILLLFAYYLEGKESYITNSLEGRNILTRIAEAHSHNQYVTSEDLYDKFEEVIIETVSDTDPRCQESLHHKRVIKAAWEEVLQPGFDYIKSKHKTLHRAIQFSQV
jgi:serine/threonine protein kinase